MTTMNPSVVQYFHAPPEGSNDTDLYITWAGHRHCGPSHNVGPRVMDSCKLVFVTNGTGYVELGAGSEPITLHKGDLLAIFPKIRHHYYADPDDPWELMWVCFNGTHCTQLLHNIGIDPDTPILRSIVNASIIRTLLTLLNALGDTEDTLRLAATGELYILFSYIRQASQNKEHFHELYRHDAAVSKAIRFIEENYPLDFDMEMLCKHVNYSRSYLSRIFKAETGMTIPEYTNNVRVQNAKVLLTETNISLREIAASVGIGDPFYFSKIFKNITGISPSAYRNDIQKKKGNAAQSSSR